MLACLAAAAALVAFPQPDQSRGAPNTAVKALQWRPVALEEPPARTARPPARPSDRPNIADFRPPGFDRYQVLRGSQGYSVTAPEPTQAALEPRPVPESPPDGARASQDVTRIAFPQWSGVLEKSWGWDTMFEQACDEIVGRACGLGDWQAFLDGLASRRPEEQLAQVNERINRVPYREDIGIWGDFDYWAVPGEFFAYGGDCEDYAIAKYYSLRALGFAAAQLRIVVLHDERRRQRHAVLAVAHDSREFVLDNLEDEIALWDALPAYRPYYSVNEETYWLHPSGGLT